MAPSRSVRFALIFAGVFGPVTLLGAFAQQPAPGRQPIPRAKNLKVLKDLPPNQLIPVMHNWSESLGVRCDYCHVIKPDHSGFDLDTKPTKETARKMYRMVRDIDSHQRVVDNKVTCFTCHHGRANPENSPPMREMRR